VRVNGDLVPLQESMILTPDDTKQLIYSALNPSQKKEFEERLELDLAYPLKDVARFRVNVFHQIHGTAGVFRMIPAEIPTLEQLGLPDVFKKLLELPNGLILVTGPTGSGKSTTLAAMIDYINKTESCHIITIEDPIEFVHPSGKSLINQRELGRDTRDFSNALHSALREDPDVILIGEMRDLETIRLALTAAETGHLVLATLHTSSAPRSVSRIVDVFPAGEKNIIRNMLSESLQAVICETLVRRIAGGRIAALEIMIGTTAIRNLIREDKVAQMYSTMQMGSNVGMCTLDQYLQGLVAKNIVDLPSARETTSNKELFAVAD
jgi:twitching motility protein PilT